MDIAILMPHTVPNKVDAKIGGHYSSVEQWLILVGTTRPNIGAFLEERLTSVVGLCLRACTLDMRCRFTDQMSATQIGKCKAAREAAITAMEELNNELGGNVS